MRGTGERIDKEIPEIQATYGARRGTTEQLLTLKLLAEKGATTSNYWTTMLLMDMSNAFNRVEGGNMINDQKIWKKTNYTCESTDQECKLAVGINNHTGTEFNTNIRVPLGDCLSPILFTLYFAKTMNPEYEDEERENHK